MMNDTFSHKQNQADGNVNPIILDVDFEKLLMGNIDTIVRHYIMIKSVSACYTSNVEVMEMCDNIVKDVIYFTR